MLFLCFTDVHGLGSGKILSSHSFFFLSILFYRLPPLHLSSSPDLLISHLTQSYDLSCSFPFSCILDVFSPSLPLSSLVYLHPSLPCGLPISPYFSPIFLLNCFVASHISSGRSSFFRQTSLFVLFDKPKPTMQLLLLFCQRHCHQIQIKACLCNTSSQDFPFQLFQNVSVQHDSLYLSPRIRSLLYRHRISTSECSSSLTIPPSYTKPSTWLNSYHPN